MKNPDIDVSTFLKGASPSFQKYIEEGLAEIQRTSGTMCEGNTTPSTLTSQSSDNRLGKLSTSLHKKHVCQSVIFHFVLLLLRIHLHQLHHIHS